MGGRPAAERDRQGGRQGQAAAGDMQQAHAVGLQAAGVSGGREVAGRAQRRRQKKNADDRIRGSTILAP